MPENIENSNIPPETPITNLTESTRSPKKLPIKLVIGILGVMVILVVSALILKFSPKINKPTTSESQNKTSQANNFTVNADLKSLYNIDQFELTEKEQEMLQKNGFFIRPAWNNEFYQTYESNRYNYIPNFVTTDSILHNYHLMFNYILEKLEVNTLSAELKSINKDMLSSAQNIYADLKGTEWENAAKRNLAFFAVGSKLFDSSVKVPAEVSDVVNKELALISDHSSMTATNVINMGAKPSPGNELLLEDYTQYIPRGHYTKSDLLQNYFKSMMWYGRLTFRFKSVDEVKSAVLISAMMKEPNTLKKWHNLFDPILFFVGKADDITYNEISPKIEEVYGSNYTVSSVTSDSSKLTALNDKLKTLAPPLINSIPVFDESVSPDREKEIKGFRFMGQRFTIDAAIFQRLMYREVAENKDGGRRMLPKGLDVPAAFGSQIAYDLLVGMGDTKYNGYETNMLKLQKYIKELPNTTWNENLYWMWMNTLKTLTQEKAKTLPDFMRTYAWALKDLQTFLSSWTELKHDTILYAKQAYSELGGGPADIKEWDDKGYVEPNSELYARLSSLLDKTQSVLSDKGMIDLATKDNLLKMKTLVDSLKNISDKELSKTSLTDEEYELIRSYGGQLEHFWLEVNKEDLEKAGNNVRNYLSDNPAALVSDVATDPNGSVLQVATGNVNEIYAIVSVDGKNKIANGSVYSYYEFTWPKADRLTDEKWRELKDTDKAPAQPDWTNQFTVR